MKSVEDSDFELPESLKKVLRPYQQKGFFWLKTLCQNGFGGILADDMGLGKTLQVIAFLLSSFEEGEEKRSLNPSPRPPWFTTGKMRSTGLPQPFPVRVLAGTAEERTEILKNGVPGEILVTSYETMRRDQELYKGEDFFCEVIDEAQYIKNAGTKGARAVKSVSAQMKLALTGTPVENRLSELWSIFDYLMPGFLYSYEHFKKNFEMPIMKKENEDAMADLQKMIRPFILRRLKKEVLSDLPDKIEKCVTTIPLEGEQKKLYDRPHVQRLKFMLENEEFANIRMQVLAELTRLRQLCCDPALVYQDYQEGAAKMELCMELLNNAVNGGHKVLLFPQFTSMLGILEKRMEEAEIGYYSLTGFRREKERMELMEKFNRDATPVFCISLKAGGTGLDLTGADVVIHYDPWWNVAAEKNQATDRAHRIGQKRVVTVYKLVAEHTIEEKVVELQQKKKSWQTRCCPGKRWEVSFSTGKSSSSCSRSRRKKWQQKKIPTGPSL